LTTNGPKLRGAEKTQIDNPIISIDELYAALKMTQNGKTPGSDGLPAEFYKIFWPKIKNYVLNSINQAHHNNSLSITQRQGVITLLPKKGKDPLEVKNWRPITLLNQDYKLAAKAIANRMKKFLENIIHSDQTGFIKNRYIGEHIMRILGIIEHCDEEEIPALFITIDFQKAFDSLEFDFVEKALLFFDFGKNILQWVKVFYTNISSCVLNNGWFSEFFILGRGMRQGCPLSPYLFIIAVELLSLYVRQNDEIQGIEINNVTHKVCQYADDTAFTIPYSEAVLKEILETLRNFEKASGLKINAEKTEIVPIGPIKHNYDILLPHVKMSWSEGPVPYLGIKITTDRDTLMSANYDPVVHKIKTICNIWRQRDLTIYGKTTIIKTLLISQLVFLLSVLPSPTDVYFDNITKILFEFLWDGKPDKIARNVLYSKKELGGVAMCNLRTKNKALKLAWVKRFMDTNDASWKSIVRQYISLNVTDFFRINLSPLDVHVLCDRIRDKFVREIFTYWCEYAYAAEPDESEISSQLLWFNSAIKIDNTIVFYRLWYTKGVKSVGDLYHHNVILTHAEFQAQYRIRTNYITYYGLLQAIPNSWKMCMSNKNLQNIPKIPKVDTLILMKKVCKYIDGELLTNIARPPIKAYIKWTENFDMTDVEYHCYFQHIYRLTKCTKLQHFQFKLLHRITATNKLLFKMKLKTSDKCSFCKTHVESILHLFVECTIIKQFWNEMERWVGELTGIRVNFSPKSILFGNPEGLCILDLISLIGKQYIFACKVTDCHPRLTIMKAKIKDHYNREKIIAIHGQSMPRFEAKWSILELDN
jgi:hypothetical protein